jgi:hypothetical protein
MATRRSRGDGGLSWDETRQRWVASLTVGYTPAGKRIVKRGSGRIKTEAQRKLREIIRDYKTARSLAATATPLPRPSAIGSSSACRAATKIPSRSSPSSRTRTSSPRSARVSFASCLLTTLTAG